MSFKLATFTFALLAYYVNRLRAFYTFSPVFALTSSYFIPYFSAKAFKNKLNYIEEKYLSDINNIIIGDDNTVKGEDNVVQGDSLEIYGDGNYVFHDKYNDIPIIGGNIVRIGKYDVDLDKV